MATIIERLSACFRSASGNRTVYTSPFVRHPINVMKTSGLTKSAFCVLAMAHLAGSIAICIYTLRLNSSEERVRGVFHYKVDIILLDGSPVAETDAAPGRHLTCANVTSQVRVSGGIGDVGGGIGNAVTKVVSAAIASRRCGEVGIADRAEHRAGRRYGKRHSTCRRRGEETMAARGQYR